jgi:hypothetical protein
MVIKAIKSRPPLSFCIIFLVVIVGCLSFHSASSKGSEDFDGIKATVNRDCAPWDGSAFTLSIPYNSITVIYISIWQAPDIKVPSRFTFPDESGRIGHAYILPELDSFIQLNGEVVFRQVEIGLPVEGEFDLSEGNGNQFKGKFIAEWGNEVAYCG